MSSAVLRSILAPAVLIFFYSLYEMGIPRNLDSLLGFLMFSVLFFGMYFCFSMLGWVLFGFPAHWFITRFSNGGCIFYIVAAAIFTLMLAFFLGVIQAALIYGVFALCQALLFKYYLSKQTKT
ncbi:hypothetical protein [Psychrosphaera aestuarii]|uniref:hypothetical protein n=1 Tax=Psychrosphaera aestuarii TaxID=1266052 RepID=UPI001B327C54|nr:hypothetical protein [Psychrosphaera aestuarii]